MRSAFVRVTGLAIALLALSACQLGISDQPSPAPPKSSVTGSRCDSAVLTRFMTRGFVAERSPDVLLVPRKPNYLGTASRPVHTGPWNYLVRVPLVFYGPGIVKQKGSVRGEATVADIAPTLASLIGYDTSHRWDGTVLREVVSGTRRPRLAVVVVLDGVGRNVLEEHSGMTPFLERAAREGIDYADATVGSSPSNTPPIHTTIGTGVYPRRHGVPHVQIREGDDFVDPFSSNDASAVRVPTLADLYDAEMRNEPLIGLAATVNWHLGMIGHGASYPSGDLDDVVLLNDEGLQYGNASSYSLPPIADPSLLEREAETLDRLDGSADGHWSDQDLSNSSLRYMSPAFVRYEQLILERLIGRGYGADPVADLVYVNMKAADTAGHRWGMTSDQVGELVGAEDKALRRTASFLNNQVGHNKWVMVVTADHGQTPYPQESGAWPIRGSEIKRDLQAQFGAASIQRVTSAGVFLADPSLSRSIARWLGNYRVGDNVVKGESLPATWEEREDELLFDITMAGREVVTDHCA